MAGAVRLLLLLLQMDDLDRGIPKLEGLKSGENEMIPGLPVLLLDAAADVHEAVTVPAPLDSYPPAEF